MNRRGPPPGSTYTLADGTVPAKLATWVVQYVDYTSKYGLGFLLNSGSSGVYFNDSTKIVLAPEACGDAVDYFERRSAVAADTRGGSHGGVRAAGT